MSTLEEITAAIERWPADQPVRLRTWLWEYSERIWDEQIEQGVRAGRLVDLVDQALEDHRAGRTRPL